MLYHGPDIVLAKRNAKLCAQQIDLKRPMVVSGDGTAAFVVDVAEVNSGIIVSVKKRLRKKPSRRFTVTSDAFGVVKSLTELPQVETVAWVTMQSRSVSMSTEQLGS